MAVAYNVRMHSLDKGLDSSRDMLWFKTPVTFDEANEIFQENLESSREFAKDGADVLLLVEDQRYHYVENNKFEDIIEIKIVEVEV